MEAITITIAKQEVPVLCLPGRPKALLDTTVAAIYNSKTKRVNEAVKRNSKKFPPDFYFQLSKEEWNKVKRYPAFGNLKYSNKPSHCFSHLGCNMLATVLQTEVAVRRSVEIIRAFTALENGQLKKPLLPQTSSLPLQEHLCSLNEMFLERQDKQFQQMMSILVENRNLWQEHIQNSHTILVSQHQILTALVEDMHYHRGRQRSEMQDVFAGIQTLERRIRNLEDKDAQNLKETSFISQEQAQKLREIVTKKAKDRKTIMKIWRSFKIQFKVDKYAELPEKNYSQALYWLENLEKC